MRDLLLCFLFLSVHFKVFHNQSSERDGFICTKNPRVFCGGRHPNFNVLPQIQTVRRPLEMLTKAYCRNEQQIPPNKQKESCGLGPRVGGTEEGR